MGKAPYMTDEGYRKYRQSLLLVLMAALNRLYKDADIDVHQSVNRSTYVEFKNMRITRRRTEEIKSKMNFIQTSYVFISKVINDTKKLNLTQKEIDEGGELLWLTPKIALHKISNCFNNLKGSKYDNIYSTKFIIKRDETILKEYILKYSDNK